VDERLQRAKLRTRPVPQDPHPQFALEALEAAAPSEQRALLETLQRLPDVLPSGRGPAALRARLLEETARAPERYAPFTRALAELYDLPRDSIQTILQRSAEPRAWKRTGLPGIKTLEIAAGSSRRDAQAYLVKLAAGVHFPAHRHDGHERVLILAGEYCEDSGRVYRTGDWHAMGPGTAHSFTIAKDEDCVAAALLEGGLNFRSLPLRLLARLLGH
jgi:predicted ChrR family anti-sigma factor